MASRRMRPWIAVAMILLGCAAVLYSVGGGPLVSAALAYTGIVIVVLAPLLYLVLVVMLLYAIPEEPELTPLLDERLPADMAEIDAQLRACGFGRVGPVALFNTKPRTRIANYVSEAHAAYATVQKLWRNPAVWGLITPREDMPGNFETVANVEIDGLPAADGVVRQVIEGADVATLVSAHAAGLAELKQGGMRFRRVSEVAIENDLFMSSGRQREAIWERPFRGAGVVLWRAISGSYPNRGSIRERPIRT